MSPEHWQRVKEVFHAALEREVADREAFVERQCPREAEIRSEVVSLLKSHQSAPSFIEEPVDVPWEALIAEPGVPPRMVGPYRLERAIAVGGMGAVYAGVRADDAYRKRVAVKLLRSDRFLFDPLRRDESLRRFQLERQTLADLDHPNIARLLDGGATDEGSPYLVMDYIEGEPIDEYCDTRGLSIEDRIRLFGAVCDAVHHAHRHLIVHRDLKPGNILVTTDGQPKLVDFGIAKLLDEEQPVARPQTATIFQPMTPEYASPEQVRGQRITTATDVYSLGVVLYELLTGHRPYPLDEASPHEIGRLICETEPEKPSTVVLRSGHRSTRDRAGVIEVTPISVSTVRNVNPERLRRTLSGDLDMIVLKALRKEPARRYASVEQFSEDLVRFLDGRPVLARPDTWTYRSTKFLRRHRTGVMGASLIALCLVTGVVATLWQASVARHQRDVAELARAAEQRQRQIAEANFLRAGQAERRAHHRFDQVRRLANSFILEFHGRIQNLPGATPAREFLVTTGLAYLDSLVAEAADDLSLKRELALAYEKVGDVQGNPYESNHLGDTTGAERSYVKCLALREELCGADLENGEFQLELAVVYAKLGDVRTASQPERAIEDYQRGLEILEGLRSQEPANQAVNRQLSVGLHGMGELHASLRRRDEALASFEQSLTLREEIAAVQPGHPEASRDLAVALTKTARLMGAMGRLDETAARLQRSLAIRQVLAGANPNDARARRDLASGHEGLANALADLKQAEEAINHYRKSIEIIESLVAADPYNAQTRRDLSVLHNSLGDLSRSLQQEQDALTHYSRSVELRGRLATDNPTSVQAQRDLAVSLHRVARTEEVLGRLPEALIAAEGALAVRRRLFESDPSGHLAQRELAFTECLVGSLLFRLGRTGEARTTTIGCLATRKALSERPDAAATDCNAYAATLLSSDPPDLRDPPAALVVAQRAVEMTSAKHAAYLDTLALAYFQSGEIALAATTQEQALALLRPDETDLRQQLTESLEKYRAATSNALPPDP